MQQLCPGSSALLYQTKSLMKEISRFYSSLSLLIVLNAIVKPIWIFGIDRQVQNEVGVAAYGTYFSILNLSIVLSFLNDWGLTVFYNRHLAAKNEMQGSATTVSATSWMSTMKGILCPPLAGGTAARPAPAARACPRRRVARPPRRTPPAPPAARPRRIRRTAARPGHSPRGPRARARSRSVGG